MRAIVFLLVYVFACPSLAFADKSVAVRSYTRKDGTRVSAHSRSSSHGGGGGGGSFAAPASARSAVPHARVQSRQSARKTARGMSGPQIVYVEGYFRKDGTWIPPHTREWDGIKNPSPPKRVRVAPSAARPALDAPLEPAADDDDDGPPDRSGKAVAAGGDWDDEDFDHLVDGPGEPVERPRVRAAARGGAPLTIPEDGIREWRDADGNVIAVGWLGSRLDGVIWIRTRKGGSVRAEVDDLCAEDRDFLDDMQR